MAVTARFAVGTQSVKESGEVYSKSTFGVTINLKNAFDGQDIPDMEIQNINVEG